MLKLDWSCIQADFSDETHRQVRGKSLWYIVLNLVHGREYRICRRADNQKDITLTETVTVQVRSSTGIGVHLDVGRVDKKF